MSLRDDILQHKSRLNNLETALVGLKLRAARLRDNLRDQTSTLTPVERLSPEAINLAGLKLCEALVKIGENLEEAEELRASLKALEI